MFKMARVLSLAVLAILVHAASAASHDITVQNTGKDARPELIFACDRATAELNALFTPQLTADLQQLNAGVALSTEDLSPERAEIVRKLNIAGIPMTAWIALPRSEGYYVNASNAAETRGWFDQFDQWTAANHLHWQAVGLDIEPTLSEYGALMGHKGQLLRLMLHRAFDSGRVQHAREAYAELIRHMQSRGYLVQTYQLAFIADERKAHTTLLERLFGIVDVRGNEEVLMLYSSFNPEVGAGLIWQYGSDSQMIAVGSTARSGVPKMDAKFPALSWTEFSRDLIVARHFSKRVGVYSLEGCVQQGSMPRLKTIDWQQNIMIPEHSIDKAALIRRVVFLVLWVGAHITYFVIAIFLGVAWLLRLFLRRRSRRKSGLATTAVAH